MNTSYEILADAAYSAAIDVQMKVEEKPTQMKGFKDFVRLLREPVSSAGPYKLLHDPRTAPFYKEAWLETFAPADQDMKTEVALRNISELLDSTETKFEVLKKPELKQIVNFCLYLNRLFLEENGRSMNFAFATRMQDDSP